AGRRADGLHEPDGSEPEVDGGPAHQDRATGCPIALLELNSQSIGDAMDQGSTFLRTQVHNAVVQHGTLLRSLEDHESQADDPRLSDLCARHIPHMREHQRMLEEYQSQLGGGEALSDKVVGSVINVARDLADAARDSDYDHLIVDIVMAR